VLQKTVHVSARKTAVNGRLRLNTDGGVPGGKSAQEAFMRKHATTAATASKEFTLLPRLAGWFTKGVAIPPGSLGRG
jgi:hypothetical protein